MQALSLELDYNLAVRFAILFIGVVLVIFNTLMYIKHSMSDVKIEKKKVKTVLEEARSAKESTAKKSNTKKSSTSKGKSTKSSKNNNKAALKDEDIIIVKENSIDEEGNLLDEYNIDIINLDRQVVLTFKNTEGEERAIEMVKENLDKFSSKNIILKKDVEGNLNVESVR